MNVLSIQRLQLSLRSFPKVLKKHAVFFITLQAIAFFFNQTMVYLQEIRMSSRDDVYIPMIIGLALVGFFVQTGLKVFWLIAVQSYFQGQENLALRLQERAQQGLIESLRAYFKAVLWGFLLILPGFWKMVRYQFAVWISASSSAYQKGDVDALKTSEKLVQGHTFSVFFLIALFAIGSLVLAGSGESVTAAPLGVFTREVLSLLWTTLELVYFYFLFHDLKVAKEVSL